MLFHVTKLYSNVYTTDLYLLCTFIFIIFQLNKDGIESSVSVEVK